ncbi:MAG: pyrimidine operon attenuation protein/uracil phosphoribosyltransferase [Limisphaerales bacterium]|jgi:pyrimidine operon attenuation protein/uracil phosphoribosyltransferase
MAVTETPTQILDPVRIKQKIMRIAYEILEDNAAEKHLIIAGICRDDEGFALAQRIANQLREIGGPSIELTSINLDKNHPTSSPIELGITPELVDGKVVVIVDDVANSGRTLLYAVKPLLDFSPKKIRVAVLVDRKHKRYPISADYVGTSLSTTLHEHINVILGTPDEGVYIS